jgi:hypothetical protein
MNIWILTAIAVINIICSATFLVLYMRKQEECGMLKELLKIIYTQVDEGTLKEWVSKTEDKAWKDL